MREVPMIARVVLAVVAALVTAPVPGQNIRDVLERVSPSVVVIRGRGRDVAVNGCGLTYISEIGSGVVEWGGAIPSDGIVLRRFRSW
jgi:hypothetical protein